VLYGEIHTAQNTATFEIFKELNYSWKSVYVGLFSHDRKATTDVFLTMHQMSQFLASSNSALNPFIYGKSVFFSLFLGHLYQVNFKNKK
jgi:hypothetical protein